MIEFNLLKGRDCGASSRVQGLRFERALSAQLLLRLLTQASRSQFHSHAPDASEGENMPLYRIREVKFIETEGGHVKLKPLREYEREASDTASVIAEVSHFFEMELSSPKALDVVDFDEVIIVDDKGAVVARFGVADFWVQEWNAVAGKGDAAPIARPV